MTLGEKIRQAREARRMTQRELADKAGLSRATIQNFEMGANMSNRVKRAVAYALGIPLLEGDLNVAEWIDQPALIPTEEWTFNERADVLYKKLVAVVAPTEREIVENMNNWLGFLEIYRLLKKYDIKPKL